MLLGDSTIDDHPGANEGERNQTFRVLIGRYLGSHGADGLLIDKALAFAGRCDPPLPEDQARKSVESLVRKHQETKAPDVMSRRSRPQ